ncbi:MAG: hypothetical protein GX907_02725 [Clostridiaceae bacterium]|nr:hypothetical protein [Clostridiaceae bacterium]
MRRYILSDDDDIVIKESQFKTVGYELLYYYTFCYLDLPKHLTNLSFSRQEIIMVIVLLFARLHSKLALNTKTAKIRVLLRETGLEEIILSGHSALREREAHGSLQKTEAQDLLRKAEIQKYLHEIVTELERVNVVGDVKGFFALQHKLGKSIPSLVSNLRRNYPQIVTANMAFLLSSQGQRVSETPLFKARTQYVRLFPRKGFVLPCRISNIPMKTWRIECYRKGESRLRRNKVNPVDIILLRRILPQREYFLRLNLRETEMPLIFCRDQAASKDMTKRDFTAGLKTKYGETPVFALFLFSRAYNFLFSRGIAAFRKTLNKMTTGSLKKTRRKKKTSGRALRLRIENSTSDSKEKHRVKKMDRLKYFVMRKNTTAIINRLRAHPLFLYFSLPLLRRLEISDIFKKKDPKRINRRRFKNNAPESDSESKAKGASRIIVAARLAILLLEKLLALKFKVKRNRILKLYLMSADKENLLRENNGLELLYEHLKSLEMRAESISATEYESNRNNLYAIQGLTELQKIVQRGILIRLLETKALLHESNLDFPFSGVYMRKILLADIDGNLTEIRQIGGLNGEIRRTFATLGIELPPGYQTDRTPKRSRRGAKRQLFATREGAITAPRRKKRGKRPLSLPEHRASGKCFISLYADRCPFYSVGEKRCGKVCAQRIPMKGIPFVSRTLAKKYPNVAEEVPEYGLARCGEQPEEQLSRYLPD